jgi:hypothetical protein
MDEKLIKQLEKADAILKAIDSEYITQPELEDVVALIIAAIETSAETMQKDMATLSENDLAYAAKCSKAVEDCKTYLEAKLKAQNDYWQNVRAKDVQTAVETAVSRVQAIKGDKGDAGPQGIQGEKGDKGDQGSPDTPEQVVEKVNAGKTLIKKERVEGLADFDKLRALGAFNPTMGPSFSDLANINRTVSALSTAARAVSINYIIDGGGSAITTGVKGFVEIPYDMTITGWQVFGDQSGSVVVDVWRSTYAGFPPVVGGSIAGSELPTLTNQQINSDSSLTTWTTSLAKGDILAYNVNSASTVTRVTVSIIGTKN